MNLYAYCMNNPVMYVDPNGDSAILTGIIIGAILGGIIGFGTVLYSDYMDDGQIFNGSVNHEQYFSGTFVGAFLGACVGGIIATVGEVLVKAFLSLSNKFITDLVSYHISKTPFGTWEDYALAFVSGGVLQKFNIGYKGRAIYDVAIRPGVIQLIKIGTNKQDLFNVDKYKYDVITRGITHFIPSPLKAISRGIFRSFWDINNRKYAF